MFEQKLDSFKEKSHNVIKNARLILSQQSFQKNQLELIKTIVSTLHVCANIMFLTRIRFPSLVNICFNENNYDSQLGCNSVFRSLASQEQNDVNGNHNGSYSFMNSSNYSMQILSFAQNQVEADSQCGFNILSQIVPFYILIFLCVNIAELAKSQGRPNFLIFILVLVSISDLLTFNYSFTFSLIKPTREDSMLFSQHFNLYQQNLLLNYDQSALLKAKNEIFLQPSKIIIALTLIFKITALIITSIKFYQSILKLVAQSINQQQAMKLKNVCNSIVVQKAVTESIASQQVKTQNMNVNSKNSSLKQLGNKILQKCTSSTKKSSNYKVATVSQSTQEQKKQEENITEVANLMKTNNQSQQSDSVIQSKSGNKKAEKKKSSKQNNKQKQNISEESNNQILLDSYVQVNENNQDQCKKIDNLSNSDQIHVNHQIISSTQKNNKNDNKIKNNNQNNSSSILKQSKPLKIDNHCKNIQSQQYSEQQLQQQSSNFQPELQQLNLQQTNDQILHTSAKQSANSNQIQILNHQISKDNQIQATYSDNTNLSSNKIQNSNDIQQLEESSIQMIRDQEQNFGSQNCMPSPQFLVSSISQNVTLSPSDFPLAKQGSGESSQFNLNDSTQSNLEQSSPVVQPPIAPCSQYYPSIIISSNEKYQSLTPTETQQQQSLQQSYSQYQEDQQSCEQESKINNNLLNNQEFLIEQVKEDIRIKWAIKQKAIKLEKKKLLQQSLLKSQNSFTSIDNSNNTTQNPQKYLRQGSAEQNISLSSQQTGFQNQSLISVHDYQQPQDDLDISTNDESNFASINSNYDQTSITKQNRSENLMNLKNLSQHLMNQKMGAGQIQNGIEKQNDQLNQLYQHNNNDSKNIVSNQYNSEMLDQPHDISAYYQNYQNAQYQEEQCYKEEQFNRTTRTNTDRTSKLPFTTKLDKEHQFFEDDYQKTSQMCFEQFIRLNQQNNQQLLQQQQQQKQQQSQQTQIGCLIQQKNQQFGFDYNDEENNNNNTEKKTPFELFYDQQCLNDEEDYDEEEELDQFHENLDEEEDEEDDDEDDDDEDDDDEDEDDEDEDDDDEEDSHQTKQNYRHLQSIKQIAQKNRQILHNKPTTAELQEMSQNPEFLRHLISNNNNQSGHNEDQSDSSTFLQSNLHQTTEIFSVDELKSHLGDYLDMLNDENSLFHQYNEKGQRFDISQVSSAQDQFFSEEQDDLADDGKKKKKKKKSKEQKRKRRQKRKLKKKLERSMIDLSDTQDQPQSSSSNLNTSFNFQFQSTKKKNNQKLKKKQKRLLQKTINNNLNNTTSSSHNFYHNNSINYNNNKCEYTSQSMNQNSQSLKRLLDENLLEYFTFSVMLSQDFNLNIYITDFYEFDEQFEMQSRIYGIDQATILDAKINLIFQIITVNLYPAMTPFFQHLIDRYSLQKISSCLGSVEFTLPLCVEAQNTISNDQLIYSISEESQLYQNDSLQNYIQHQEQLVDNSNIYNNQIPVYIS